MDQIRVTHHITFPAYTSNTKLCSPTHEIPFNKVANNGSSFTSPINKTSIERNQIGKSNYLPKQVTTKENNKQD